MPALTDFLFVLEAVCSMRGTDCIFKYNFGLVAGESWKPSKRQHCSDICERVDGKLLLRCFLRQEVKKSAII